MKSRFVYRACAKVNLSLFVTGKREDGYHLLDSVMQSVDLCDTVTVTLGGEGITIDSPICNNESNVAYKAALLYLTKAGLECGVNIAIDKCIPACGGLGGGSADAAAVLAALNKAFGRFDLEELCALAVRLGADVPFCLTGGTARCLGIGEIMQPVVGAADYCMVLISDGDKPSTGEMYRRIDGLDIHKSPNNVQLAAALACGNITAAAQLIHNDFAAVWPGDELDAKFRLMYDCGAIKCGLSGSGPTVFGLFTDAAASENCVNQARKHFSLVSLCRPSKSGLTEIE